ncbi:hypothetical protein I5I01_gp89 [Mycobacterium phage MooMoo]|uniref:Uncharacterized protein n=1 Tax=Mycobacterium phage MooMoo TaxID=2108127 RepID=A0A2P1JRC5_9CAUD|nr:hypothetical protein I5I01_gp89 [Mycobacterium phage MooMoo]AVO21694.1 hypothetical protein SEA_MOOMOO_89 [Mycobacterium phage MooMoo]
MPTFPPPTELTEKITTALNALRTARHEHASASYVECLQRRLDNLLDRLPRRTDT